MQLFPELNKYYNWEHKEIYWYKQRSLYRKMVKISAIKDNRADNFGLNPHLID